MTENKYPLDDNEDYLDSLDMSRNYTDEEIRDIYNVVFHRNDPRQIEAVGEDTEKFHIGNIFVAKRHCSDEEAKRICTGEYKEDNYLRMTGRISEEEFNKIIFIKSFKEHMKGT